MIDVIILAAGSIKDKLHFANFIFDSPALIPINVRSSVSYILDFYYDKEYKINIITNENDKSILEQELLYYKNINIVAIQNSSSVIDTLNQSLKILNPTDEVIVNLVTTIPTTMPSKNTAQISSIKESNADWSGVKLLGDTIDFYYKTSSNFIQCNAFTGVFRCFAKDLDSVITNKLEQKDLLNVVEDLYSKNNMQFEYSEWIDCGHELNFYDAKAKLISSRSFNSIKIETIVGVITKSSKNIKKFNDEIRYIELIPKEIKIFFPSIYSDVRLDSDCASVKMEYYGYSTLAEYMLYWNIKNYVWEKIFQAIYIVLTRFKQYKYSIGFNAYYDFYFNKTLNRVDEFKKQLSNFDDLFTSEVIINGRKLKNFDILEPLIELKINKLYSENDFCIMHGDLCFNNILYDIRSGIIRLIDARGSFGDSCIGIYGDIKYDLAKLSHSIIGGYDFIVNNLFSLEINNNLFTYSIMQRENYQELVRLNEVLIEQLGYKKEDILFLVGLLFISMCSLHNDDTNRQITMYLHGITLLNDYID